MNPVFTIKRSGDGYVMTIKEEGGVPQEYVLSTLKEVVGLLMDLNEKDSMGDIAADKKTHLQYDEPSDLMYDIEHTLK
jgi:hypothetical protein